LSYKYFIAIFVFITTALSLVGQTGLQKSELVVDTCSIRISNYTVLPSSIRVFFATSDLEIPEFAFTLVNNQLVFDEEYCFNVLGERIRLEFRSFPVDLYKEYFLLDSSMLEQRNKEIYIGYDYSPFTQNINPLIEGRGLDYSGSFSRGFAVGNSQSMVLNSRFDLQLLGDLGDGLKISAAISDDNIPIQPQGNTLVLQEFDRVFIEISKDKTAVNAGDYELRSKDSYFMDYYKKLKGLGVENSSDLNNGGVWSNKVNITSSRGKFARQTLQTREGNQGPYRLLGNNNERFIIVLSGTERVYFDGELLRRGLENDYIIDYQSAEITFTANRMISRERRIIIDFEYTDLNYFRTLYSGSSAYENKGFTAIFNFYSEQDSKNATGQLDLDSLDIAIMENSGDNRDLSRRSGVRSIEGRELAANAILYELRTNPDFPVDTNQLILVFSTNPNAQRFTAFFSEVDAGNGSYAVDNQLGANGRVYRYVGPGEGRFEPLIELIPPEKRQMMTAGATYQLNKNNRIGAELALSNLDLNRFSPIDNQDNAGLAALLQWQSRINLDSTGHRFVQNDTKIELLNRNFNPLNPYRPVEFARDWNIKEITNGDELYAESNFQIDINPQNDLLYGFSTYRIDGIFSGNRHKLNTRLNSRGYAFISRTTYTHTEGFDELTDFLRPNFDLSKTFSSALRIGMNYDGEYNFIRDELADTLKLGSNSYDYIKNYIQTDPNKSIAIGYSYNIRTDRFSKVDELLNTLAIREHEVFGKWLIPEKSNLNFSIKTRNFRILEEQLAMGQRPERTLLGAIDHQMNILKNLIVSSTNYQLNSGQEPKLEFVFTEIEPGRGDYIYVGNPQDSIRNINDFRFDPSNPLANYIRIILPNNEFIRTNNISFNQSVRIDPQSYLRNKKDSLGLIGTFFSKFSTLSSFKISKRKMDDGGASNINFLDLSINDTSLVAFNSILTNSVFFNRGNPKYDVTLNFRNNTARNNQLNGAETRGVREEELRTRWNFMRNTDFIVSVANGVKSFDLEIFNERNFIINYYRILPEISWRYSPQLRITGNLRYEDRRQTILKMETAKSTELALSLNHRKANRYALDFRLSMVRINYDGESNVPIEFDLLDGLKNGNNFLWFVSYTQRLGKNLDLNINYEGRKTGISPTVHVARAQIKATF
jgi:hypothetical protein